MQSVMFDSLSGPFMNENLIHNRLNIKGYINDNITVGAGVRNRLFTGDMVRLGSYYSGLIGADPGKVYMSWNLNDLFNAYSFFDFDYAERPGSDAVRLQYFTSSSSSAELAVKVDADNDVTAAGLWRFNKWGYDFQFLAGFSDGNDVVLGTGW